jgi:phage tail-like protein
MDFGKIGSNIAGGAGGALGNKALNAATGGLSKIPGVGGILARTLSAYASAATGNEYPNVAFRFNVEIDGIVGAQFTEMSGADWEMAPESFHEGGLNFHQRHLVTPAKFTPLTLKRGFTSGGSEFFLWMKSHFEDRSYKRRNLSVVIMNQEGIEVGRFNFKNAFISKYTGPSMNANDNNVAFESVQLHYDYFEYQPRDLNEVLMESAAAQLGSMVTGMF